MTRTDVGSIVERIFSNPESTRTLVAAGCENKQPSANEDVAFLLHRISQRNQELFNFDTVDLCGAPGANSSRSVWLEIEPDCNWHCRFCYNYWRGRDELKPSRLTTERLTELLDKLYVDHSYEVVAISGGEPLLRRDLEDIVQHLKAKDIRVVLTTNGQLLNSARLEKLRAAGLDAVQIAIHSTTPAVHNYLTGRNSWRSAVEALLLLVEKGVPAVPVFVGTRVNVKEFPAYIAMCATMGVTRVVFNKFVSAGLGSQNAQELSLSREEAITVLEQGNEVALAFNVNIQLGVPINLTKKETDRLPTVLRGACSVTERPMQVTVGSSGDVRQCSVMTNPVGNLSGCGLNDMRFRSRPSRDGVQVPVEQCLHEDRRVPLELITTRTEH